MKRVLAATILIAIAAVVAAATWRFVPAQARYYTDADTIREPLAGAPVRDILWQPARPVDRPLNTGADDYEPRFSADGMTLYFVRGKAGENADIYFARHTPRGWGDTEPISDVNSEADELGPEPSADGQSLYFYSNRAGGLGGYDLWVVRRMADGWSDPTNLGPEVNSPFNDYGLALTPDGTSLYFSSNRPQPADTSQPRPDAWPATLREDLFHRTYDLYVAAMTDSGPGKAVPLNDVNTPFNEGAPAISPFADFIYFASDRPGGEGGFDLYRSRRLRGGLETPLNLGAAVNTAANELDPAVSLGGFALYFSSDRLGTEIEGSESSTASKDATDYNLYQTISREVFVEIENVPREPIDWAAVWSRIGPNLLWALLALLLLLALLALYRSAKSRRLSLLARCLLASIAAHLLLMMLLHTWEVAAALAGEFRRRGRIQVSLASPSAGGDIAAQLLAGLSDFEPLETADTAVARVAELPPLSSRPFVQTRITPEQPPAVIRDEPLTDQREPSEASVIPAMENTIDFSSRGPAPLAFEGEPTMPAEATPIDVPDAERVATMPPSQPDQFTRAHPSDVHVRKPSFVVQASVEPLPPDRQAFILESRLAAPLAADVASTPQPVPVAEADPRPVPFSAPREWIQPAIPTDVARQEAPPEFDNTAIPEMAPLLSVYRGVEAFQPMIVAPGNPVTVLPVDTHQIPDDSPTEDLFERPPPPSAPVPLVTSGAEIDSRSIAFSSPDFAIVDDPRLPGLDTAAFEVTEVTESAPPKQGSEPPSSPRAEIPLHAESRQLLPMPATTPLASPVADGGESWFEQLSWKSIPENPPWRPIAVTSLATAYHSIDVPPPPSLDPNAITLPEGELIPVGPLMQRLDDDRLELAKRRGGSEQTEQAVERALKWLANHQSRDGRWDADRFDSDCRACGGETDINADIALTGLSLLSFLGAGHTHTRPGPYQDHVRRAVDWLMSQQADHGDLRGEETMYSHGIATIALAESLTMTGDRRLEDCVNRAVRFIDRARNRDQGGWRYDPGQEGDTSVLGWQVMALKSAQTAGVDVPRRPFDMARRWLDRVSTRDQAGLYAYQPGDAHTPSMTAEAMFTQLLLGMDPRHPRVRMSVDYILDHLPHWDEDPNTYFWYYASLALFHHQGPAWQTWNDALSRELIDHQRTDGKPSGSWDPVGQWAEVGGRVYQTALCTLMLEVYYRYLPMYSLDESLDEPGADEDWLSEFSGDSDTIGAIQGRVTDATTGAPLTDAKIILTLPDRISSTAVTDDRGRYVLATPEVPEFFALSASLNGYVPETTNVERSQVEGRTVRVDFTLSPASNTWILTEVEPEVHHLGDDQFEGRINSQFQKDAEGAEFSAEFTLAADQELERWAEAEVVLLAKGVQRRHRIVINGRTLERRLESAPADGSFGEFIAPFDPRWLRAGPNTLQVIAAPSDTDIDDFEFVNVRIRLIP